MITKHILRGGTILISFYILSVSCENILYGVLFACLDLIIKTASKIAGFSNPNLIQYAFCITATIFIGITIWAFLSREKNYNHPVLTYCYVGIVIVGVFNMFWGWTWLNIVVDIISIVLVSFFIYFDTITNNMPKRRLLLIRKLNF